MRQLKTDEEAFGTGNLTGENSLVPAVQELWNTWEIHCLILISLSLQAFLFLFADMRRRSSSRVLRTVLWLAYLAADSVAIFVLGHLAVRAGQPGHQLMAFWAPFVLVHLGGQDTITAFSREDNVLWKRHLLSLVTQVAIAGYVVAKASWPDVRLKAAMVLIFVSGCFRYAERTGCLYLSSPAKLRSVALGHFSESSRPFREEQVDLNSSSPPARVKSEFQDQLSSAVESLREMRDPNFIKPEPTSGSIGKKAQQVEETLDKILKGSSSSGLRPLLEQYYDQIISDLMSADVPVNWVENIAGFSGTRLVGFFVLSVGEDHLQRILQQFLHNTGRCRVYEHVGALLVHVYLKLYTKIPFRKCLFIDLPVDFIHNDFSQSIHDSCDFVVVLLVFSCYIIFLLYTIFQFASAPIALVLFWAAEKGHQDQLLHTSPADITVSYILLVGAIALDVSAIISIFLSYFQVPSAWYCNKKQWSEKLGQYNIINRHVGLPEVTHTTMSKEGGDDEGSKPSPTKEFILDNLLGFGTRKQWYIASTRGRLAIEEWMMHRVPESERPSKALVRTTSDGIIDFQSSVLIWHIATDICYYHYDSTDNAAKKHKQISKELSNYIMYLIFKRGVMLTTNSQLSHELAHESISTIFILTENIKDIKEFVMKLFDATKNMKEGHQEEAGVSGGAAAAARIKVMRSARSVLPRACELAQELISISDETERWELIASVWAEMAYYIAPRCGAAFHYEHLSTGGEFITHLLVLMYILGPFMPDHA